MKTSRIEIGVQLDHNHVPEAITWQASDSPEPGLQQAGAMLLALWDARAQNAWRIDLWTKTMTVAEMNAFVFQTLVTLADTYLRATGNNALMAEIKQFAQDFAAKAARQ